MWAVCCATEGEGRVGACPGRTVGLPLMAALWGSRCFVCVFHPLDRSPSQSYHVFQRSAFCLRFCHVRAFPYRSLRRLLPCGLLFFFVSPRPRSSRRVSANKHTLFHSHTSSQVFHSSNQFVGRVGWGRRARPCLSVAPRVSVVVLTVLALLLPTLLHRIVLFIAACWCGCCFLSLVPLALLVRIHLLLPSFPLAAATLLFLLVALLCSVCPFSLVLRG